MAGYKVRLKDSENHDLELDIGADGITDIKGNQFTAKFAPDEIKHSLDAIIAFTGMLDSFNLNSIEIERQ